MDRAGCSCNSAPGCICQLMQVNASGFPMSDGNGDGAQFALSFFVDLTADDIEHGVVAGSLFGAVVGQLGSGIAIQDAFVKRTVDILAFCGGKIQNSLNGNIGMIGDGNMVGGTLCNGPAGNGRTILIQNFFVFMGVGIIAAVLACLGVLMIVRSTKPAAPAAQKKSKKGV